MVGSRSIVNLSLQNRLLDELNLLVYPVLIGQVRALSDPDNTGV